MSLADFADGVPLEGTDKQWFAFNESPPYSNAQNKYRHPAIPRVEPHHNRYAITAFILGCLLHELHLDDSVNVGSLSNKS